MYVLDTNTPCIFKKSKKETNKQNLLWNFWASSLVLVIHDGLYQLIIFIQHLQIKR